MGRNWRDFRSFWLWTWGWYIRRARTEDLSFLCFMEEGFNAISNLFSFWNILQYWFHGRIFWQWWSGGNHGEEDNNILPNSPSFTGSSYRNQSLSRPLKSILAPSLPPIQHFLLFSLTFPLLPLGSALREEKMKKDGATCIQPSARNWAGCCPDHSPRNPSLISDRLCHPHQKTPLCDNTDHVCFVCQFVPHT